MNHSKHLKWLAWCEIGAKIFATCGKRQYMAIVVDRHGHVLGTGYNGAPSGAVHCIDGGCPRLIENSPSGSNYDNCVACHAEQNALLHSDWTARKDGSILYVNGPPCFTCAKLIANSGISTVVCITDTSYINWHDIELKLTEWNINVIQYTKDNVESIIYDRPK